jgi:hypothetical protein
LAERQGFSQNDWCGHFRQKDADVNDLAPTSDKECAGVNNSNLDNINATDNSPDNSDLSHVDPPHHDKAFTTALILSMLDVSDSNPPNIDQIMVLFEVVDDWYEARLDEDGDLVVVFDFQEAYYVVREKLEMPNV